MSTTTSIRLPILIALAAAVGLAQDGFSRGRDTRDPSDPRTRLERAYERAAHDALVRYFSENTFLVKARVDLEDPEEEPEDLPAPAETRAYPKLPGLPYQPLDLPAAGSTANAVQLRNVDLDVLVDTGYTQKDRDFIQYLVTISANLDTARGDLIRVTRAYFPRDDRSLRRPREPWSEAAAPPADSARPDTLSLLDTPLSKLFGQRLISQLPLLLVCLTLLVCVWIWRKPAFAALPLSLRSRLRRPGRRAPPLVEPEPEPSPARDQAPTERMTVPVVPPREADPPSGRTFLVNSFVGEPRASGQVLRSWMERDPEKGAKAAAILLRSLNPKFLDLVREALGEERAQKVERLLSAKDGISESDLKTVSKGFRKEFLAAVQGRRSDKGDDLFGFLDQLNEGQIMHLLKDEPLGVAGFVLAQVSPAKSGAILQKLDAATRARFLYAIGNITQIPREVYKEMADRLSLKALEVSNMKFVASDGVESLVQLIESLPVAKQFEYLHSLTEVDLNLAKKIRERTVTFPELASLPDRLLAKGLQSADGETLGLSLQAAEPEHRARFLQLLPERMRLMAQSALESKRDATPADVEAAQNRLLALFREEIRRTGRPS